jgi:mRNA interferase MazF
MNDTMEMIKNPQFGEIWMVELDGVANEQRGKRPCLCVSNSTNNRFSPNVTIIPLTSQLSKPKLPVHVAIPAEEYGLNRDSILLVEAIRTVSKTRFTEKLAAVDDDIMDKVKEAIALQCGFHENTKSVVKFTAKFKRRELTAV